jgi:hypothetical protein
MFDGAKTLKVRSALQYLGRFHRAGICPNLFSGE